MPEYGAPYWSGTEVAAFTLGVIAAGAVLALVTLIRRRRGTVDPQARALRMARLYQALSRTNQVIARERDVPTLYREICRVCVETGHACMAYIGVADGAHFHPVASAGPAEELLAGLRIDLDPASPHAQGPASTAMREGRHQICNDFLGEPRTAPWHERGRRIGIRAQASFPFRRGGRVEGVLTVYMDHKDFFDDEIVALLDEMAGDVSFGLDNIDLQAARDEAQREARIGYENFRQVFQAAPAVAVIIAIDDRRILKVNAAACQCYGYSAEEMVGQRFADLAIGLSDADRAQLYLQIARDGAVHDFHVPMRVRSGEWRDFIVNGERLLFDGRDCVLTLGADVTEARAAGQAREARIAAEAASRAKTDFLSRMSHELRTPLNALLGFAQLMQSDAREPLGERQRARIGLMVDAGWHLLDLVGDVLDVSRIEAGQMNLELRAVAVREVLDAALSLTQALAVRRNVTLLADYRARDALAVHADGLRLRQVLLNLLSNAIKYNRHGGSVRVDVVRDRGQLAIEIVDDGIGMTPQQLERLFEPFNRLGRERGEVEGTGLGLALSRQLVQLMHGRLEIDSQQHHGTRVRVVLPQDVLPAPEPAPSAFDAAHEADPEGSLLYIEDNLVNVLLVEQLLERWPRVRMAHA
ncbi:MAG TPA: ATP-binding protein, partial [Albitalea sp.]|nr:ATP-binding protein [Albitalea sp.]